MEVQHLLGTTWLYEITLKPQNFPESTIILKIYICLSSCLKCSGSRAEVVQNTYLSDLLSDDALEGRSSCEQASIVCRFRLKIRFLGGSTIFSDQRDRVRGREHENKRHRQLNKFFSNFEVVKEWKFCRIEKSKCKAGSNILLLKYFSRKPVSLCVSDTGVNSGRPSSNRKSAKKNQKKNELNTWICPFRFQVSTCQSSASLIALVVWLSPPRPLIAQ